MCEIRARPFSLTAVMQNRTNSQTVEISVIGVSGNACRTFVADLYPREDWRFEHQKYEALDGGDRASKPVPDWVPLGDMV